MIPTEKLNAVTKIIVHDNCPDGLASALLLHDALPQAEIQFVQHGSDAHKNLKPEPGLLFADFAPYTATKRVEVGPGVFETVADYTGVAEFVAAGTIVLDHHKTAKEIVSKHGALGVFGDEKTDPGVCGAVLAYREVWLPLRADQPQAWDILKAGNDRRKAFAERFAHLAGVRDTWQRESADWFTACKQAEMLLFMPRERWLAMNFVEIEATWDQNVWIGDVLIERQAKHVKKTIEGGHRFWTTKGTSVIMFSGVSATSDAAEALGLEVDLVVGFTYFVDDVDGARKPKMIISTRSHKKYDCSSLAKHYGGGGHTAAAGFNRLVQPGDWNPYNQVEGLINAYEATLP